MQILRVVSETRIKLVKLHRVLNVCLADGIDIETLYDYIVTILVA